MERDVLQVLTHTMTIHLENIRLISFNIVMILFDTSTHPRAHHHHPHPRQSELERASGALSRACDDVEEGRVIHQQLRDQVEAMKGEVGSLVAQLDQVCVSW